MKKFFAGLSGAIILLPGIGTMVTGLSVPPDHKLLFGGVSHTAAMLGAAIVVLLRGKIRILPKKQVAIRAVCFGVAWVVLSVVYLILSQWCVVSHPSRGTAYYPLHISGGEIEKMVSRAGGRSAAIERYGIAAVRQEIANMPQAQLWQGVTTAILILLYQGLYSAIVVALLIAWAGTPPSTIQQVSADSPP